MLIYVVVCNVRLQLCLVRLFVLLGSLVSLFVAAEIVFHFGEFFVYCCYLLRSHTLYAFCELLSFISSLAFVSFVGVCLVRLVLLCHVARVEWVDERASAGGRDVGSSVHW